LTSWIRRSPLGTLPIEEASAGSMKPGKGALIPIAAGDDFGHLAGLVARVVMEFSFRVFARLLLIRILVVGHLMLL
jgi:hypothetical protein